MIRKNKESEITMKKLNFYGKVKKKRINKKRRMTPV